MAFHGALTATLWVNVGYRISRNGSGKSANAIILWDRVPAFSGDGYQLGIHLWSVFVSDRFMLPPALLVSYHLAEVAGGDSCRGGNSNMADLVLLFVQQNPMFRL